MRIGKMSLCPGTKRVGVAIGAFALFLPLLVSTSCATPDDPVFVGGFESSSGAPDLGGSDASLPDVALPNRALCDTTECPAGRATCPGDRFSCAADLLTDDFNCGVCGNACPGAGKPGIDSFGARWACVDGRCTMRCSGYSADCNGVIDDGCEVELQNDRHNCGACGNECTVCQYGVCDCADLGPQATLCGTDCVIDMQTDENHCGSCSVRCPPGEELNPEWNASVGCVAGECNKRECHPGFGDCNHDLQSDDGDGCEKGGLGDDRKNCGGCGVTCRDAEICFSGQCFGCEAGETLCDPSKDGVLGCFVLVSDPDNCGGCGKTCPASPFGTHGTSTCVEGVCGFTCDSGYANCDGSKTNGCEIDTRLDPDHCGGCGRRCPLAGQACVEGQCVQVPCSSEPTR